MKKQDLFRAVVAEAKKLKEEATSKELAKLNYAVNAHFPHKCIYGQMTGYCFNVRAQKLIKACTPVLLASGLSYSIKSYNDIKNIPSSGLDVTDNGRMRFSPIESYIALEGAQKHVLVAFLKGEKDKLFIKDLTLS